MIKRLLKKIFPIVFLKRCFLVYNELRIKTIDKLLFPEYPLSKIPFLALNQAYPFQITIVQKQHFDLEFKSYMDMWDNWSQEEYIVALEQPCLIEPSYGWAIVSPNYLIYPSLGMSRTLHQPKPDVFKLFATKRIKEVDCLISLRDTGEENYFHFYNDVLCKLFYLEEHLQIDTTTIPILISHKLWGKAYFQYFLQFPWLKSHTWLVQDDYYVKANKVYFCKPLTHTKKYYDRILELVPTSKVAVTANRKVFLTRSPHRLRYIENQKEITTLCERFGFEIIDADNLSIQEQILLFSQTRYLIGIHGAGLTNMLYRKNGKLSVLEIFPPATHGYLPFQYILMANMYQFSYDGLIGKTSNKKFSGSFIVDIEGLEKKVLAMIG